MKRNNQIDATCLINNHDLIRQIAFHEAGHAAAIYLHNKQRQLPPVSFQIIIKSLDHLQNWPSDNRVLKHDHCVAVIEGGCLIQNLPMALIEIADYFSTTEQDAYLSAFEADMINLLIGPLAEAKHVALRDNEQFNAHLVTINALHHYGGSSDLEKVHEYLDAFITTRSHRQTRLSELLNKAFHFLSLPVHWRAVEGLADYILNNRETTISYEEAIAVLDESTACFFRQS